jgi:hypothetical protein
MRAYNIGYPTKDGSVLKNAELTDFQWVTLHLDECRLSGQVALSSTAANRGNALIEKVFGKEQSIDPEKGRPLQ